MGVAEGRTALWCLGHLLTGTLGMLSLHKDTRKTQQPKNSGFGACYKLSMSPPAPPLSENHEDLGKAMSSLHCVANQEIP